MWLGLGDPAATQERLRENDPKLTTLIRVATVWRKAFGSHCDDRSRGGGEGGGEEEDRTWEDKKIRAGRSRASRRSSWRSPAAARRSTLRCWAIISAPRPTGSWPWRRYQVRFERTGTRQGVALWTLTVRAGRRGRGPLLITVVQLKSIV